MTSSTPGLNLISGEVCVPDMSTLGMEGKIEGIHRGLIGVGQIARIQIAFPEKKPQAS